MNDPVCIWPHLVRQKCQVRKERAASCRLVDDAIGFPELETLKESLPQNDRHRRGGRFPIIWNEVNYVLHQSPAGRSVDGCVIHFVQALPATVGIALVDVQMAFIAGAGDCFASV